MKIQKDNNEAYREVEMYAATINRAICGEEEYRVLQEIDDEERRCFEKQISSLMLSE